MSKRVCWIVEFSSGELQLVRFYHQSQLDQRIFFYSENWQRAVPTKKWVQIQRIGIESCKHVGILELETTKFYFAT